MSLHTVASNASVQDTVRVAPILSLISCQISDFTFPLLLFIIHCQSLKLNTKLTKTISFTERPPETRWEGYCGAEKVEEILDKQYSDNKCMCCFCLEDPKSRLIWTFYHCRHKYLGYHPFWAFYKIQYLSLCFVLDNIYQGNLSLSLNTT